MEGHGTDMVMEVWGVKVEGAGGGGGGEGGRGGLIAAALRQTERQMPQHTRVAAALLPPKMAAVVHTLWWTLHSPAIRKIRHNYRETRHKF